MIVEDSDTDDSDDEIDDFDETLEEYEKNLADLDLPEDLMVKTNHVAKATRSLSRSLQKIDNDILAVISQVVNHFGRRGNGRSAPCQCLRKQITETVRFEDIANAIVEARNYMRSFDETSLHAAYGNLVAGKC
jgi:hypothetical protein